MTQQTIDFDRPIPPIQCDPADVGRLTGQNLKIIERLRQGPATNRELSLISLKYTGRVSDCRRAGYKIVCEKRDGGLTVYSLEARN
jgi:hypothetical protein